MFVLPAPTVYYWCKERRVDKQQSSEFGESFETENPLAPRVEEDPGADFATLTMPRSRLAKLRREANEVAQLRQQNEALEKENSTLRRRSASSTTKSNSGGNDTSVALMQPATAQLDEVETLKKLAEDASLSEETRQSAQANLQDHFVAQFEVASAERHLNRLETEASFQARLRQLTSSTEADARAQMLNWVAQQRLRRHLASIVRVVGPDASPEDLMFLSEENLEEIVSEMNHVEKLRFTTAVHELQSNAPEPEPDGAAQ